MTPIQVGYRAYLLRLWLTPEAKWRASIEDPHTGERRAFATLAQLVAFLEEDPAKTTPGGLAAGRAPRDDRA